MDFRRGGARVAAVSVVPAVGSSFRLEGRGEGRDLQAEPEHHLGEDVIGEKAQPAAQQLHRDVPITQMVGRLCDQQRIAARRLEQRLVGRHNLDSAAILESHALSAVQHPAPIDHERRLLAVVETQEQSALAASLVREVNTMGDCHR